MTLYERNDDFLQISTQHRRLARSPTGVGESDDLFLNGQTRQGLTTHSLNSHFSGIREPVYRTVALFQPLPNVRNARKRATRNLASVSAA